MWDTARVFFENITLREVFGLVSVYRTHRGDAGQLNFCGPALTITSIPRQRGRGMMTQLSLDSENIREHT
jgi:hypothetical protein